MDILKRYDMNSKEEYEIGKAAAKAFAEYWEQIIAQNPDYNNNGWVALIGIIYFSGFSAGYDHYKQKAREIAELN